MGKPTSDATPNPDPLPPWRQPRGKWLVSLVNSHTNATSKRWHLWEIDLRFALNSTPGWPVPCQPTPYLPTCLPAYLPTCLHQALPYLPLPAYLHPTLPTPCEPTLEVTQGQILSQSLTDATDSVGICMGVD